LNGPPLLSHHYPHHRQERRNIEKPDRHHKEHSGQQYGESDEPHPLVWNRRQHSRPEHHDLIRDKPAGVVGLLRTDDGSGRHIGHSGQHRRQEWIERFSAHEYRTSLYKTQLLFGGLLPWLTRRVTARANAATVRLLVGAGF